MTSEKNFWKYFFSLLFFVFFLAEGNAQATYYWVGGTGNWNDLSHWATASGGTTKHTIVPSILNNVVFDSNSFTAAGQTVTVNQEPYCKDMIFASVGFNPTFTSSSYNLNINGNFQISGNSLVFSHTNGNITVGGDFKILGVNPTFSKTGGTFTVGDSMVLSNITSGTFLVPSISAQKFFTMNKVALTSASMGGVTVSNGSMIIDSSSYSGTINLGNISLPLGRLAITNWVAGNVTMGSVTANSDTLIIDRWNSGNLTMGNILANTGGLKITRWAAGNYNASRLDSDFGSLIISDWTSTTGSFNFSSTHVLDNGDVLITNCAAANSNIYTVSAPLGQFKVDTWTGGNLQNYGITANGDTLIIKNWAGGDFGNTSYSYTANIGGVKLLNWTKGNFYAYGISSTQGSFIVDNWVRPLTGGSAFTVNSSISLNNGDVFLTNCKTTNSYINSISAPAGQFRIDNWTGGNLDMYGLSCNGDTLIINNWSGGNFGTTSLSITANIGGIKVNNWTGGHFYAYYYSSSNGGFTIDGWNNMASEIYFSYTSGTTLNMPNGHFLLNNVKALRGRFYNVRADNRSFNVVGWQNGDLTFSSIVANGGMFKINNYSGATLTLGSVTANLGAQITNWSGGNLSVSTFTTNLGLLVDNWSSGNFVQSGQVIAANGGLKFSNFSAGNITASYDVKNSVRFENLHAALTFLQNTTSETDTSLIFTNAAITYNTQSNQLLMRGNFEPTSSAVAFKGSGNLYVGGSFDISGSLLYQHTGTLRLNATTSGKIIKLGIQSVANISFEGVGGVWTVQDKLTVTTDLTFVNGSLYANGKPFSVGKTFNGNNSSGSNRLVDFTGVDTIYIGNAFYTHTSTFNLVVGTAVLKMDNSLSPANLVLNIPGKTLNDVIINQNTSTAYTITVGPLTAMGKLDINNKGLGAVSLSTFTSGITTINNLVNNPATLPNITLNTVVTGDLSIAADSSVIFTTNGNNTFGALTLPDGTQWLAQNSRTQTMTSLALSGSCTDLAAIFSTVPGSIATLSDLSGTNTLDYIELKDISFSGGATWQATNAVNRGNVSGTSQMSAMSGTFYWVGNGGTWTDPNHWSATSGGTPVGCIPSLLDTVVFDVNSFSLNNQTVSVVADASMAKISFLNVTNAPTISVVSTLNFTVTGDYRISGNTVKFYHNNGNLTIGGNFIVQSATLDFDKRYNTFSIGGSLLVKASNADFYMYENVTTVGAACEVTGGTFTMDKTYGNFTVASKMQLTSSVINISKSYDLFSIGDSLYIKSCTGNFYQYYSAFNVGKQFIIEGNGIAFNKLSSGSFTIGQDLKFISTAINFNSEVNLTVDSLFVKNSTGTLDLGYSNSLTVSSRFVIDGGNIVFRKERGTFSVGSDFEIKNSTGLTFARDNITPSYGILYESEVYWTVGGNIVIQNAVMGTVSLGNLFSSAGNFTITNSRATTINIMYSIGGDFSITGSTAAWTFFQTGPSYVGGNFTIGAGSAVTYNGNSSHYNYTSFIYNNLRVRKSFILNANTVFNFPREVRFQAITTGHTINLAGKTLYQAFFEGIGGGWTLASNFKTSSGTTHSAGNFTSAGFAVDYGPQFLANYTNIIGLNYTGTDTVRAGYDFQLSTNANTTLTIGTAVVLMNGPSYFNFYGGHKTFNDVLIKLSSPSSSCTMSGNNNFKDVTLILSTYNPTSQMTITINDQSVYNDLRFNTNKKNLQLYLNRGNTMDTLELDDEMTVFFHNAYTHTVNALLSAGACGSNTTLRSDVAGLQATLHDANGGTNTLDYITLRDMEVTGASWIASNVVNNGNNTGWSLTAPPTSTFYWIGGAGNWNDASHWSYSSGGPTAGCSPLFFDNVIFDGNSFTANNQMVTLTAAAACKNMTWTSGVNTNPNFNSNGFQMNIYGDAIVNGQVNWNMNSNTFFGGDFTINAAVTMNSSGTYRFVSDSTNNVINLAGKFITSATLYFDAVSTGSMPKWTLMSELRVYQFNLIEGEFVTNGNNCNFGTGFNANSGSDKRVLNFTGISSLTVDNEWNVSPASNTTLIPGQSTVTVNRTTIAAYSFAGGNKKYYNFVLNRSFSYTSASTDYSFYFIGNDTFNIVTVNYSALSNYGNLYFRGNSKMTQLIVNHARSFRDLNVYFDSGVKDIGTYTINHTTNSRYFQYYTVANNKVNNLVYTGSSSGDFYQYVQSNGNLFQNQTFNQSASNYIYFEVGSGRSSNNLGNITINQNNDNVELTFYGNSNTYGNFVINNSFAGRRTYFYNSGTSCIFGNFDINLQGTAYADLYFAGSSASVGNIDMQMFNQASTVNFNATGNFTGLVIDASGTAYPDVTITQPITIGTLDLPAGFELFLNVGTGTVTTTNFIPRSNCLVRSRIVGNNASAKISQATGTINTEWITLQTHTVTGGAVYNASNATSSGVTGWNVMAEPPLTFYWVGGTGNWNNPAKWSFSSGGVANTCNLIPASKDNVVFDQSSFTGAGQSATLNVNASVNNLYWNSVLFNPTFAGTSTLAIGGNLVINSPMIWNLTGTLNVAGTFRLDNDVTWNHTNTITFNPTGGAHEINLAGKTLARDVVFSGTGGSSWTLKSDFAVNASYTTNLQQGSFISDGYNVNFGNGLNGDFSASKTMDFTGTSLISCATTWRLMPGFSTLIIDEAVIEMTSSSAVNMLFEGGGLTYGNVEFLHTNTNNQNITISDNNTFKDVFISYVNRKDIYLNNNNTFANFTLSQDYANTANIPKMYAYNNNVFGTFVILSLNLQGPEIIFSSANTFGNFISVGRNSRLTFPAGITQTMNGPVQVLGTGGQPIFMNSGTPGSRAIISRSSGEMCFDYIWIKDINATGGANYNGGQNGVDLGNNVGIVFNQSCPGYYWVGGSGNWSDTNHWATASGGATKHVLPPSMIDNVYFDANSFSATGQIVTMDIDANCKNIEWLSALFNPTLTGTAAKINVHGSMGLTPNMNLTWQGNWVLEGDGNTNTVDFRGQKVYDLELNEMNSTGGYNLSGRIDVLNNLKMTKCNFSTNNYPIFTKNFIVAGSLNKMMNLGTSTITIDEGAWDVQSTAGLSMTTTSSKIKLIGDAANVAFKGNSLTYNQVEFTTNTTLAALVEGNNNYTLFKVSPGLTMTLQDGTTQTATTFDIAGDCDRDITLLSSTPGSVATLSKSSGNVSSRFLNISDVAATGGATFQTALSTGNGNTPGWNFLSVAAVQIALNVTQPVCPTPNNGAIVTTVTGGLAPYEYSWSTLDITPNLANLSANTYSVTVTDESGCTASASAVLSNPVSYGYTATATGDNVCFGVADGMISVSAPGGSTPLSYLWNNGSTTALMNSLGPGSYMVTVTDVLGCRATASTTVTQSADINATYTNSLANCTDIAMNFTGSASGSGLTYSWNFGDATSGTGASVSHTFTTANTFTVALTVTAGNGCTDVESKNIEIKTRPQINPVVTASSSCTPGCNGLVNLNVSGGTSPYTVQGGNPVTGLCAGSYTFTAVDANGCTSLPSVNSVGLNDLTPPSLTIPANITLAANSGCSRTGVTLGSFSSTDNCTSSTVTNNGLVPATYPLGVTMVTWTATDGYGNSTSKIQTVTITSSDIELSGNSTPIANGDIVPSVSDNTDFGSRMMGDIVDMVYTVANGGNSNLQLTGSPRVTLTGASEFTVFAQPAASLIPAGSTTFTIRYAPLLAGVDQATVNIMSNDCDEPLFSFAIEGNVACDINVLSINVNDETCPNANDGSVMVSATCPTCIGSLEYSINGTTYQATGDFNDLADGNYTVYIRDSGATTCQETSTITIAAGVDVTGPIVTGCPASAITVSDLDGGNDCETALGIHTPAVSADDYCIAPGLLTYTLAITNGASTILSVSNQSGSSIDLSTVSFPKGTNHVNATFSDGTNLSSACMFNVVVTNPEIDVRGLGTTIVNGDNMPSALDDTYFGETTVGSIVDHTFTITNTGPAALGLTGNPKVIITGSTEFSVFMEPSVSSVNPAGTTTFVVRYQPQNGGLDNAIIEIQSDDCDDASFTFTVSGLVNCSINITYVNVTPEGCPGANDGAIAITAVCTSCLNGNTDIRYSLDNMNFINTTGLFTSLAAGNYTAYVRDVNDVSCNANDGPHAVAPGVDAVAPQISCPSNIGVSTDAGVCSAVVTYTAPVGTDNCSSPVSIQTAGLVSGSAFPLGTTTQTFRVTDGSGTTAVCSFDIIVSDNEAPQITCPSNIGASTDAGLCTAVVAFTAPVGTDNCSSPVTMQTAGLVSGSAFPLGTTTQTFRVTDGSGTTAICSFDVTVSDNEAPQITCPSNIGASTDAGLCTAVVAFTAPVGTDNCSGPVTMQTAGLASGSSFPLGTTTQTYQVTDGSGTTAVCSFAVTVSDNEAPQITCPSNIGVSTDVGLCSAVVTFTAPVGTDNCSGAVTMQTAGLASGSSFPLGTTTQTFQVTDGSGTTAACSFAVNVSDNEAPQIVCPSNIVVGTDAGLCSAVVTFTAPVGTDNCSGQVTMQTAGLASGSAFPLGTTTQTYQVTDGSGTTAVCSFAVTVSDNEAPQIVCPTNVIVDTDPALCTASNVALGNAMATDNCNMAIVPSNDAAEPYQRGINTIIWTANDGNGNISTCSQTVTVLYPEINITGNGQTIVNGDNTTSTADFTDFGPQSPGSQTDKTFMVQNTGSQTLQLTGMPIVTISGDAEFSVLTQPLSSTIATGAPALSLQIRYAPLAAGNHTAVVSIQNNDCDESAYTFTVSSCATSVYYKDQDGDGYGNPDSIRASCFHPSGYVTNNQDCNDNAPALNIQPVVFSHDGICYATLEDALDVAGVATMQEVLIHADASPNEINTIPPGVTVRVLSGTWSNHMMLKNNGLIILENGSEFMNLPGGVYKGTGTFNGLLKNMGGSVKPGN